METVRVQDIATLSNLKGSIPDDYIRLENEQPETTTIKGVVLKVPVIDLSDPDHQFVLASVSEASKDWGIFQVVNHGIPNELISKLQKVGKEFFELPQDEKEVLAKPIGYEGVEGYGSKLQKEVEGKKGWVDHLFHRVWPPSLINYKFWPKNPPSYRKINEEYTQSIVPVANKLFGLLSEGLGLEEVELKQGLGGEELVYLMKINYYPPCPCPELALGVVPHTDMSAITILVPNEVQGLQVFKNDHWYDVAYIPNALIIHIGDQLEILSNGKYKSVYHRTTVNKEKTRMSWPMFLEPPPEIEVGPVQRLISEENPPKFKTKKYKDYVYCKLNKLPQ
ncbi:flavonol synthase/flavanone 3-hydroxylase-like [Rutidosis leptorrhynchoides]|uniref:flavonol synthase/flavanone 3-hydroxylase-like n=1 Tax=Rutidosis leptorrhynchoides TaxID=125765 RepID=UPI003A9A1ED5